MQGVLYVDVAREEGSRGDHVRMLSTEQSNVTAQPHAQHAQLV